MCVCVCVCGVCVWVCATPHLSKNFPMIMIFAIALNRSLGVSGEGGRGVTCS